MFCPSALEDDPSLGWTTLFSLAQAPRKLRPYGTIKIRLLLLLLLNDTHTHTRLTALCLGLGNNLCWKPPILSTLLV